MLTETVVEDASVAMAEHEYETVWNGTMERNGQHPGLSRMTGPSSAQLNMDLPEAVHSAHTSSRSAEVFHLAATPCMVEPPSTSARKALQELFVCASARRAERRRFVDTLRKILEQRLLAQPPLLLIPDRRRVIRET